MSAGKTNKGWHYWPFPGKPDKLPRNATGQTLGEALLLARRSAPGKISQEKAAESVGVSRVAISDYERDNYRPTAEVLDRLMKLYQIAEDDLGFKFGSDGQLYWNADSLITSPLIPTKDHQDLDGRPTLDVILRQLFEGPSWPIDVWLSTGEGSFEIPIDDNGREARYRRNFRFQFVAPQGFLNLGRCIALDVGSLDWQLFPFVTESDLIVCLMDKTPGPNDIAVLQKGGLVTLGRPEYLVNDPAPTRRYVTLNPWFTSTLEEWEPVGVVIAVFKMTRHEDHMGFELDLRGFPCTVVTPSFHHLWPMSHVRNSPPETFP